MELKKKFVRMGMLKEQPVIQIALDDDFIVSDTKPDIEKIILERANVEMDDNQLSGEKILIKSNLFFNLLYHCAETGRVESMSGSIPFEETVNVEGWTDNDIMDISCDVEDLSVSLINSRKVNVKAIVTFNIQAESIYDEEVAVGVNADDSINTKTSKLDVTQLVEKTKDTFRVRDEVELETNRPNIDEIAWKSMELSGFECRPLDGSLSIRGELRLFIIYQAAEEHIPLQWMEKTLSFSGTLEMAACTEEMIASVQAKLGQQQIEAKADYDGELRNFGIECVLELDIKLYEDEQIKILEDVYTPAMQLMPEYGKAVFQKMLIKNLMKNKINDRIKVKEDERILQICHQEGSLKIDRSSIRDGGIQVDGALCIQLLYLVAEDRMPLRSTRGTLPFQAFIEVAGIDESCHYQLRTEALQLGAMMLGSGEIEIKAIVSLEVMVLREITAPSIRDMREQPWDMNKIESMPGIVGYIVQPGDNLWKIAKEFHSTVDILRETNSLTAEEVSAGDRLLIVKQVAQML